MLYLHFLCRLCLAWKVLSYLKNVMFWRLFFSCPLLIPCPSPSEDPQKLFLCDCFVLWQDDIDAYKTQNQFLNSEIHQVTRLWTRVAENEKALLMKVRQNSSFSLGTAFSKFFPKWALGWFWYRNSLGRSLLPIFFILIIIFSLTFSCFVLWLDMIVFFLQSKYNSCKVQS